MDNKKVKITLTIDKDILEKAKKYAKKKGITMSQLVEGIFIKVLSQDNSHSKELKALEII